MESPLNAREFLGRFHLPQLVRISLGPCGDEEEDGHGARSLSMANLARSRSANVKQIRKQQQHEPSEWTYREPASLAYNEEDEGEDTGNFHSVSAWSSAQVSQMLERRAQVRVPRAALKRSPLNKSLDLGQEASLQNSLSFNPIRIQSGDDPSKIGSLDRQDLSTAESQRRKVEQSIKLAPPSEQPARAKLQLEQPFLLYKALRKLELEAYALDPQNELEARSGDPIYFPQQYPGWFSFASPQELGVAGARLVQNQTKGETRRHQPTAPLETIDQVCRAEALVFLSRDELLGYQLPSKLSHLTKLNNNQLLALPLAINLDKKMKKNRVNQKQQQQQQQQQQEGSTSISDIKQVTIASGQVLRICGIYEDVLPLIEGKQQLHKLREFGPPIKGKQRRQQEAIYRQQYLQQNYQTSLYQLQNSPSHQHHKLPNYSDHYEPRQLIYASPPRLLEQQQQQRVGQRYVRCILLNESSSTDEFNDDPKQEQEEEAEVLVPMDQRGRFYLCATNQTLLQELNCSLCSLRHSNLVFQLSQLVYLLNLSRRLGGCPTGAEQQPKGNSLAALRLPLTLRLVHGPRPSNYSPTMFGCAQPVKTSSTRSALNSYFQRESNVAGHSLQCTHNKNHQRSSSPSHSDSVDCACARRLTKASGASTQLLGSFSGLFRIETLTKRDVLLACTIKRQPLLHLPASADVTALADSTSLGETLAESAQFPNAADSLKALGKSSFRRLRACRSLISLNGRRSRRRPKIPSALLDVSDHLPERPTGGAGSVQPARDNNGNEVGETREETIVMVEFDCDEAQLRFVRTFVESSIPSASIPDLVLHRLDHCARESRHWQRQLKLAYSSLARDFDSWGRQMELSRRPRLTCLEGASLAAPNPLAASQVNPNLEAMAPSSPPPLHQAQSSTSTSSTSTAATKTTATSSNTESSSNSSTARSSSGVSSATANDQQQLQLQSRRRRLSPGAASSSQETLAKPDPEGAAGGSRLLRLVQLVLPQLASARQRHRPTAVGYSADGAAELLQPTTLMNAQKLHRRLLQRPLAAAEQANGEKRAAAGVGVEVEPTTTKEDSASHLYESLERLNEAAGRLAAVKAQNGCTASEAAGGGGGGGGDGGDGKGDGRGGKGGGGASKAQSRSAAKAGGPRRTSTAALGLAEPLVSSRCARANSLEAANEDDEEFRRDAKLDSSYTDAEDEAQWRWPEEEEEEDWWPGRRRTAATKAASGTVASSATGELCGSGGRGGPGEPMEPVSIEHDDYDHQLLHQHGHHHHHHHYRRHRRRHFAPDNNSSSHHSSASSLDSPVSAPRSQRTVSSVSSAVHSSSPASSYRPADKLAAATDSDGDMIEGRENIYVNLVDVDGASWCSSGIRRAGRMGRKVAKLRRGRRLRKGEAAEEEDEDAQQWERSPSVCPERRSLSSHHLQPHHHHHHHHHHHNRREHHHQKQRSRLAPINPFRLSLGSFGESAGAGGASQQQAVAR